MSEPHMLQPPGALLRYLIGGWTAERRSSLLRDLNLWTFDFEMLLLGARPFSNNQIAMIARATGISEKTFRELEDEFTAWSGVGYRSERRAISAAEHQRVRKLFFPNEILRRVAALALEMSTLPKGNVILVPILKGGFIFSADLIRFLFALGIDPLVEFTEIRSYQDDHERFGIIESKPLTIPSMDHRTVLIVDDICDTGLTFEHVRKRAISLGAEEVLTCAFIDKRGRRESSLEDFRPDYVGFTVEHGWMVGYGMDDGGHLRGLPEVGELLSAAHK